MWNLEILRDKLGERLAEAGNTFWGPTERDGYLNEAQRQIAAITGGVIQSACAETEFGHISLPSRAIGEHAGGAMMDGGHPLIVKYREDIERIWPGWRNATTEGIPRWIVLDIPFKRAYLVPHRPQPVGICVEVAVLPNNLVVGSDEPFNGIAEMEKFQGALLNLAASLALLKERYDGDAERFYQWYQQEMVSVGVSATRIPNFRQLAQAQAEEQQR